VVEAGLTPFSHGDYDPGRRFYFLDPDGIEYEVVSYASGSA
jgi:glyoxylase I family protein